ncbi:LytTR family DNA-binding domain-containing protein [Roseivirga sp. E12]|uniref:LytR/AlgR family response regulator transcription factor n=1 Tax=Roseivirga sp. E12 TaxID=2819237 RepID=UPI001ABC0DA5|nr:LytTR family DNA-binding domain-containing protein [Roseivirga sp. E12]MBO3700417.1 response regulator transcription factor [Roseivirga sp. E12]
MRAVIIEDEALSAKRLAKLLKETFPLIEVVAMLESVNESLSWFHDNDYPDLVFLDIQLNDGTGFEILRKLDGYPHIIFTTAYEQYALDAFKFNSIDYLLKPIDKEELLAAINKLEQIHKSEESNYQEKIKALGQHFMPSFRERFLVKVGLQFKSILTQEVAYFSYKDGLSYLHTIDQCLPIDYTLDHLIEELDPKEFFRINRQYIVSLKSVNEIHSYFNSRLLLALSPTTDEEVIVSRERVLNFKIWAGM